MAISLTAHTSIHLRLLTIGTPVSVLGTLEGFVAGQFSLRIGVAADLPQLDGYSCFNPGLAVKALAGCIQLTRNDSPCRDTRFCFDPPCVAVKPSPPVREYKPVSLSRTTVRNALRSD